MRSLEDLQEPYGVMFVDAMNLLSRSFYGMPLLEYRGKKTGMLLGVARLAIDWRKRNPKLRIVFVWEGRDSWRKARYPIYKAQRKKERADQSEETQHSFLDSLEAVKESLAPMGIEQVSARTYEADDTVWTAMGVFHNEKRLFASTDWDWWPLVEYGDILYQNDVFTEESLRAKFAKKFNCEPIPMSRMWVFKVLTGDPSDNVSGIPRMPKKVASVIANDLKLGPGDVVHGLIKHGFDSWAEKVAQNVWILERNLELLQAKPPPADDLDWVAGEYDKEAFGEVLLKSGMGHLYDRLTGGDREE